MTKHIKYLWYVTRHKYFVFIECCKLGVPWRGITHDMSKFLPDEWSIYTEWYYGNRETVEEKTFDEAWLRHQKRNPHHWQYWILVNDNGEREILEMPDKYRREMLADWRSVSGNNTSVRDAELHPTTLQWIEGQLSQ